MQKVQALIDCQLIKKSPCKTKATIVDDPSQGVDWPLMAEPLSGEPNPHSVADAKLCDRHISTRNGHLTKLRFNGRSQGITATRRFAKVGGYVAFDESNV